MNFNSNVAKSWLQPSSVVLFFFAIVFNTLTPYMQSVAGTPKTKIVPAPKAVSPHVYAWIGPLDPPNKENQGYRMNMAFVVGKDAVMVIDSGYTPAMANEMLAHIRHVTKNPVRYVVNTNSQPHRFMGNDVFRKLGADIITHPEEAKRMKRMENQFITQISSQLELGDRTITTPVAPNRLITQPLSLNLGDLEVDVIPAGAAHTPYQLVVHIKADDLVYAGDILYTERLLAILPDSRVNSWIKQFEFLKSFGAVRFIPGHGQIGKLKQFEFSTLQYLKTLQSHMVKMVEDGVDIQEAINSLDQSPFSKLANYEQLAGRNASWTFLEMESASFE